MDAETARAALAHLHELRDGWHDGDPDSLALSHAGLDWLAETMAEHWPGDLPTPRAYPTAEGGVSLEWDAGRHRPTVEVDLTYYVGRYHCFDLATGMDHDADLSLSWATDWTWLAGRLRAMQGEASK
jgi:hypothetical protein